MAPRSSAAAAWHRLYDLSLWRHPTRGLRAQQLKRQPLCERHLQRNQVVPARAVNHRRPHKGDMALFRDPANLESVCTDCHDSLVKIEEARGHVVGCDATGQPRDPKHPWNRRR